MHTGMCEHVPAAAWMQVIVTCAKCLGPFAILLVPGLDPSMSPWRTSTAPLTHPVYHSHLHAFHLHPDAMGVKRQVVVHQDKMEDGKVEQSVQRVREKRMWKKWLNRRREV